MLSWLFSDPLPIGASAPDFSLPDDQGRTVSLRELRGTNVILVWYPADDTPTCRQQLCEMRDNWSLAQSKNIAVYGINAQAPDSHRKFRDKYNFPFPLLVDKRQKVGALYHTKGLIVRRTVYLIGKDGTIRYAQRGKPQVEEVLAAAQN